MHRQALILVRLLSLAGLALSLYALLANLAQSYDSFNPSYIGFFLKQQVLRPAIGALISLLLGLFARRLARRIARGTED